MSILNTKKYVVLSEGGDIENWDEHINCINFDEAIEIANEHDTILEYELKQKYAVTIKTILVPQIKPKPKEKGKK